MAAPIHLPQVLSWRAHRLEPSTGLGAWASDWEQLNHELCGGHPLLASAFVNSLLETFARHDVYLCIGSDAGVARAMCLLQLRSKLLGIWSSFLPAQAQIGPSLFPNGTDTLGLMRELPGRALELDLLCSDPRFGDLRNIPHRPTQALPHALTMNVSLAGSFDDYWAQRPRKLIQNMRRYLRRLQSESTDHDLSVDIAVSTTPVEVGEAIKRYADLESNGWKGRQGTALTEDNPQGRFYTQVMMNFAERGEALAYELRLGDQTLASRLVLRSGGMAIMLKTTFDEGFERLAPGRILLLRVLEDLFNRLPGGVVEFYTDAEADLLAWSTSQRWINHVSIYRHRALPALYGMLRQGTRVWGSPKKRRQFSPDLLATRSGATVERCRHPRELPEDALALLSRHEQAYVEFGADWFGLLIDNVFRESGEVELFVLRRQGRARAILPVVYRCDKQGREVAALANYYTTLYAPILADDVAAEDLLPLTLALKRNWQHTPVYRFAPMDPQARSFGVLKQALQLAGLRTHAYFAFGNWYLKDAGDWQDYLKNRSGQMRSTIKRMTKRLAAENGHLEIIRDKADVERGIAAYQQVYAASWKVPEPYVEFMPELIRLCARRGWLRLGLAWIGDQPIAAQVWIVSEKRAHIYKVAYDEAFKAIAPGTLVTALLLEQTIDHDRVSEVDYLIGDDLYKRSWMSDRRERWGIVAYNPFTIGGLFGLLKLNVGHGIKQLLPEKWWLRLRDYSGGSERS